MHFQKLVDVGGIGAGTLGDALLARMLENVGIAALGRSHRRDNRELALEDGIVEAGSGHLILHLAHAGHHAHDAAHAAKLLHLADLIGQIVEIKLAGLHLFGHRGGFFRVDVLGSLLNQRNDVAHAQNTIGDTARIELLQRIHLFAGGDQLDRLAGDGAHRKSSTAAAIAVHAGQHQTGDADALIERTCKIDSVLAGQSVGDEQDFMRVCLFPDVGHFDHQRLVDMRAAGGVENNNIMAAKLGGLYGAGGDLDRRLAGNDRQRVDAGLYAELAQLLLGGGAARIERRKQHLLLRPLGQALADLAGRGGLARALQADHHDDDGGRRIEVNGNTFFAEHADKFVMDDLDDHLAGLDALEDLGADRLGANLVGEGADDIKRNVGFEEGAANLAQRGCDVGIRQRAATGQAVQNRT